jgi:hypothetical protein
MDKIVERIEREACIPGLASILAERLSSTDLQSLLLEVYRIRSRRTTPATVLTGYETNRFVRPSTVSPTSLLRWEQIATSNLPQEFQPIALSPVCPLGTNAVVAPVNQNWAVTTSRNTEVVSDSTNVMALECALRRRAHLHLNPKSFDEVHLATSHRLLRAKRYESPGLAAHFSSFALSSAGRDLGNLQFELAALGLHIRFYLQALRAFLGADVPLQVSVTDFYPQPRVERIEAQLFTAMRAAFTNVDYAYDEVRTSGRGYYLDLCFHIYATAASGKRLELVDGGAVDWTQRLLSNAKERLVISGIGSERLCACFSGDPAG